MALRSNAIDEKEFRSSAWRAKQALNCVKFFVAFVDVVNKACADVANGLFVEIWAILA